MTREELQKIVAEHHKWIFGEGGSRANLYGADLSGADLSRANLSGANLYGANLYGCKVKEGASALSLAFAHPWELYLFRCETGIAVMCGCRFFPQVADARKHWLAHAEQQRRDVVLPALDALLLVARAQGWEVDAPTIAPAKASRFDPARIWKAVRKQATR